MVGLAARWAAGVIPAVAFHCRSDVELGAVAAAGSKGLALDDTTLRYCPGKVPAFWPNTLEAVSSLRLFKAWDPAWPEEDRPEAWRQLVGFAGATGAKLFLGTQVTCSEEEDEREWLWVKQLLRMLGPGRVMGLSVGNELELLHLKAGVDRSVTPECIRELWEGGGLWLRFVRRVAELDALGFGTVPVTSVFGGAALAGEPFLEQPGQALVASFLRNATRSYGGRFVFVFNFYPYFDPSFALDKQGGCDAALHAATCWGAGCNVPATAALARHKIAQLTGRADSPFWLGETGWSSPRSSSLDTQMAQCTAWSSAGALQAFYSGFLAWDLETAGARPPDHVFYFTVRDSLNFGVREYFGLVHACEEDTCKLRSPGYRDPMPQRSGGLGWLRWALLATGGLTLAAVAGACARARLAKAPASPSA